MMKSLMTLTALSLLLIGCGGPMALTPKSNIFMDPGGFKVVATKADAIISQRQVLPNFKSCLQLPEDKITNDTRLAVSNAMSSFSLTGSAETISAPMLMAFVKVAGELCDDVVSNELNTNQRRFFQGFNIGGTTNTQPFNIQSTIQKFANGCWGRAATTDEINVIIDSLTSVGYYNSATLATSTSKNTAIYLCTTMLASSQAIKR
ncbi:MAG: hypothetical protein K2Q26_10440 [Bdellovibrionales bacterium]|nr:hypothetical protein [Bdellovibrionales bacterium]